MNLPIVTLGDIRSWGACVDPAEYAPKDWTGNALDILNASNVPPEHKLWCVKRTEMLPEPFLSEVTVAMVLETLLKIGELERSKAKAAADDVWAAALAAAWAADQAEWKAAQKAAWAAAWKAAREAQVEIAKRVIQEATQ